MFYDLRNVTPAEGELISWQYKLSMGGFKEALWDAIRQADGSNQDALYLAFPEQIVAYRRFSHEPGYWQDVLRRAKVER